MSAMGSLSADQWSCSFCQRLLTSAARVVQPFWETEFFVDSVQAEIQQLMAWLFWAETENSSLSLEALPSFLTTLQRFASGLSTSRIWVLSHLKISQYLVFQAQIWACPPWWRFWERRLTLRLWLVRKSALAEVSFGRPRGSGKCLSVALVQLLQNQAWIRLTLSCLFQVYPFFRACLPWWVHSAACQAYETSCPELVETYSLTEEDSDQTIVLHLFHRTFCVSFSSHCLCLCLELERQISHWIDTCPRLQLFASQRLGSLLQRTICLYSQSFLLALIVWFQLFLCTELLHLR